MTIGIIPISGNMVFDYFFTMVFVLGCISIGPAMLFKLLRP